MSNSDTMEMERPSHCPCGGCMHLSYCLLNDAYRVFFEGTCENWMIRLGDRDPEDE
jgi:hypothetical protein